MNFKSIIAFSVILYVSQVLVVALTYYIFALTHTDYNSISLLARNIPPFLASILVFTIMAFRHRGSSYFQAFSVYLLTSFLSFFVDHILFDLDFYWSTWSIDFMLTIVAIFVAMMLAHFKRLKF